LNGATTLDCAVVGGYAASTQVSKLLPDASDDVNSLDPNGKRLGDLIAPISNSAFNSWKKLEVIPELYIPFRSGRNGRKISYRYANRYETTPSFHLGLNFGVFRPFQ
jgi:hypothetical protein